MTTAREQWLDVMAPEAWRAYGATGVLPSVILAQWSDETAFGTSPAWIDQHNPAGIGWDGSTYWTYPSVEAGVDGWVAVMLEDRYADVRRWHTFEHQAVALGQSPWAGGHYDNGAGAGSSLLALGAAYNLARFDPPPDLTMGVLSMLTADAQVFVRFCYRVLLHREADVPGYEHWVGQLTTGAMTPDSVMAAIQDSPEGVGTMAAERNALHLPPWP